MSWNWWGGGRRNYQNNMAPPDAQIENPNYSNNSGNPINIRGGERLPGQEGGRGIRPGGMIDDTPDLIPPGAQPPPFAANGPRFNNPLVLILLLILVVVLVVVAVGLY